MKAITVNELVRILSDFKKLLATKVLKILIVVLLGGCIGFLYAALIKPNYISKVSFVVEESKMSSSGLASIAGQFGFDLGGGSSGVLSGDNVILFLTSESLCRETLLTSYDEQNTLADIYAEVYGLKNKWKKNPSIGDISFNNYSKGQLPRKLDSLLQFILKKRILLFNLSVVKPNSKSSFVEVKVKTRDEKLSKLFSDRLVNIATRNYVNSKIKIKASNIAILQRKADSLSLSLDEKTYAVASTQQNLVDVNPALRRATVGTEISNREKVLTSTLFAEVVKNLEMAKTILSQETPVVQIVDSSPFPLEVEKISKFKGSFVGALVSFIIYIILLVLLKWLRYQLKPNSNNQILKV